jgi:predicted alpha/beta hydrolase family esterase
MKRLAVTLVAALLAAAFDPASFSTEPTLRVARAAPPQAPVPSRIEAVASSQDPHAPRARTQR